MKILTTLPISCTYTLSNHSDTSAFIFVKSSLQSFSIFLPVSSILANSASRLGKSLSSLSVMMADLHSYNIRLCHDYQPPTFSAL